MKDLLARILLNRGTAEVTRITLYQKDLKFRCQRCASLCCKLGGPPLTQGDIDRIEKAGYNSDEFSGSASVERFELPKTMRGVVKSNEDGSCIFLRIDEEQKTYECSIYDCRPALCRLYPFYLEMADSETLLLNVIPCCKGLNDPDGERVNEEFIVRHLREPLVDLLGIDPERKSS